MSLLEPTDLYNLNTVTDSGPMQAFMSTKKGSHQGSPPPTSPASSDSSFSHEGSIHSERDPPRKGDPAWIARPRNPFIIFRCEYSREHSRGDGKRVRRPPGSQPVEKTLSKRAAEAWHQLSPEEKNRFKELADMEKEEHARLYPNYRFKPMKRNTASGAASGAAATKKGPTPQPLLMPKSNSQFLRESATADPSSLSGWNSPPMVSAVPSCSAAWDPMTVLTFGEQSLLPFMDYSIPIGIDERELSAALAHYVDGLWLSEPFAYHDGSGELHAELGYPWAV